MRSLVGGLLVGSVGTGPSAKLLPFSRHDAVYPRRAEAMAPVRGTPSCYKLPWQHGITFAISLSRCFVQLRNISLVIAVESFNADV